MAASTATPAASKPVVVIDYADLSTGGSKDLGQAIDGAFGYDGYGIIAIRGVPGLKDRRAAALPFAHAFSSLPEETQNKYVHEESSYSFGWSHGKEKMSEGKPDYSKGSYYFNPTHDEPFPNQPEVVKEFASFAHPNIWPKDDLPAMQEACKALGQLIVDTGALLAVHVDRYVRSQLPSAPSLEQVVRTSRVAKARLLYYYPVDKQQGGPQSASASEGTDGFDSWCGWHNDHGSLTGLAPAMYVDTRQPGCAEVPCPDPGAGLYVRGRHGETVRVSVPSDCLAYQIGETAQIHSGGLLQATPHAVRAAAVPGIARATLAVFMEPEWPASMATPSGADPEKVLRGSHGELLPKGVPPLVSRWAVDGSQSFGQFTTATLKAYYG